MNPLDGVRERAIESLAFYAQALIIGWEGGSALPLDYERLRGAVQSFRGVRVARGLLESLAAFNGQPDSGALGIVLRAHALRSGIGSHAEADAIVNTLKEALRESPPGSCRDVKGELRSGRSTCSRCGLEVREHPRDAFAHTEDGGWLYILCDGARVRLL